MKLHSIIESNTSNGFVYRGMSNEEWETAIGRGYIMSDCRFAPYEHQSELSCFGDYEDAKYYAVELPIEEPEHINWEWRSETPRNSPYYGVVVEVPRDVVFGHDEDERVHEGEFWAFGPLPIDTVRRAWKFVPKMAEDRVEWTESRII